MHSGLNTQAVAGMTDVLQSLCMDLLRSDYRPSSTDKSVINRYISRQEDELASALAEFGQLQERLQQMYHSTTSYRSLLAPIRRLPSELLSEIFLHSVEYDEDDTVLRGPGFVRASSEKSPLLLLQVSARWRDVALKTPRLWANMSIWDDTAPDLLNTWLSRSGSCPLELMTYDMHPPPTISMDVTQFQRLRYLEVETDYLEVPTFLAHPVDMPFLESFKMHVSHRAQVDAASGAVPKFASAPRLRYLSVTGLGELTEHMSLPWSQSTHLCVGSQTNTIDILRRCTNLVVLELGTSAGSCSFDLLGPSRPVYLAHLTRLEIRCLPPSMLELACLDLPSLRCLTTRSSHDLTPLLQRFGGQLETLHLEGVSRLSREEMEALLALLPQLRHLRLNNAGVLRVLSQSIAVSGKEHGLTPRLQSLHVEASLRGLTGLVNFIRVRWNGGEPGSESIRRICAPVPPHRSPSTEQMSFLRKCLDEGLILGTDDGTTWPVRAGDEELGFEMFGWEYPGWEHPE